MDSACFHRPLMLCWFFCTKFHILSSDCEYKDSFLLLCLLSGYSGRGGGFPGLNLCHTACIRFARVSASCEPIVWMHTEKAKKFCRTEPNRADCSTRPINRNRLLELFRSGSPRSANRRKFFVHCKDFSATQRCVFFAFSLQRMFFCVCFSWRPTPCQNWR